MSETTKQHIAVTLFGIAFVCFAVGIAGTYKRQEPTPAPPQLYKTMEVRLTGDDGPLAYDRSLIYRSRISDVSPDGIERSVPQAIEFEEGSYCGPRLLDGKGPVTVAYQWSNYE